MARNFGHGHVYPREDGVKARCGGPGICNECALDQAQKQSVEQLEKCSICGASEGTIHQSERCLETAKMATYPPIGCKETNS